MTLVGNTTNDASVGLDRVSSSNSVSKTGFNNVDMLRMRLIGDRSWNALSRDCSMRHRWLLAQNQLFPRSVSCTAGKETSMGHRFDHSQFGKRKLPMRVWKGTVFTPITPLSS